MDLFEGCFFFFFERDVFIAIQGQGDPLRTMISQENVLTELGEERMGREVHCGCAYWGPLIVQVLILPITSLYKIL